MEKRKRKKTKFHYTVMIVSDSPAKRKKEYSLTTRTGKAVIYLLGIFMVIGLVYGGYSIVPLVDEARMGAGLRLQLSQMAEEKQQLVTENEELKKKVTILSDTVNQKVEAEAVAAAELEEKSLPKGFPLSGTATMQELPELEEGETRDPIVIFLANQGISVISSGSGTVSYVGVDEEYGNVVKVDHGNGYVSVYRCESDSKVQEGDEVLRGTILFEMKENEQKLGYQILLEDVYVDPLEVMEIYG